MRRSFPSLFIALPFALALVVGFGRPAAATTLIDPFVPSWAGSANTTSQTWTTMFPGASAPTSSTAVNAQTSSNPNGTAQWYDAAAATDGDFNVGGDAYSFSGVLNPVATVPGYNIAGNKLNVVAEVQFYGGAIDTGAPSGSPDPGPNDPSDPTALTATYTDSHGVVHTNVPVNTLPGFSYTEVYNSGAMNVGFGEAYQIDGVWAFTLPQDTSNLQLSWDWGAESSALEDLSIYTQSVAAVPEPGSLLLAGLGALGVLSIGIRRARNNRA